LDYIISKIIYKILYNWLIYIGLENVFKVTKDIEIFINWTETFKYYCYHYIILKSTYIISYIPLSLIARPFTKIYIDTIEYKPLSINGYKYIIHILDRYSNYQWIFFTKTKEIIFTKFIKFIIFIENQTLSLKIQIIHLDNNIEFYFI